MKLKLQLLTLFAAASAFCAEAKMPELYFNPPPRELKLSKNMDVLISNGQSKLEIVVPEEAGQIPRYAGEEIQKFLQQGTKSKIPLLTKRGTAEYAIILGNNAMLKKAFPNIDVSKITLDGYFAVFCAATHAAFHLERPAEFGQVIRCAYESGHKRNLLSSTTFAVNGNY